MLSSSSNIKLDIYLHSIFRIFLINNNWAQVYLFWLLLLPYLAPFPVPGSDRRRRRRRGKNQFSSAPSAFFRESIQERSPDPIHLWPPTEPEAHPKLIRNPTPGESRTPEVSRRRFKSQTGSGSASSPFFLVSGATCSIRPNPGHPGLLD